MKKYLLLLLSAVLLPGISAAGGMDDDPLLTMLVVDQFELRNGEGQVRRPYESARDAAR